MNEGSGDATENHSKQTQWTAFLKRNGLTNAPPSLSRVVLDLRRFLLEPWHENMKKRQVKSPKVFLQDSGLLHSLLEIHDQRTLLGHPKLGASWEGFALDQIIRHLQIGTPYFWATDAGAELDPGYHRETKVWF